MTRSHPFVPAAMALRCPGIRDVDQKFLVESSSCGDVVDAVVKAHFVAPNFRGLVTSQALSTRLEDGAGSPATSASHQNSFKDFLKGLRPTRCEPTDQPGPFSPCGSWPCTRVLAQGRECRPLRQVSASRPLRYAQRGVARFAPTSPCSPP